MGATSSTSLTNIHQSGCRNNRRLLIVLFVAYTYLVFTWGSTFSPGAKNKFATIFTKRSSDSNSSIGGGGRDRDDTADNADGIIDEINETEPSYKPNATDPGYPFWEALTTTKKKQIENYRKGKALILNVHVTHHAGTAICSRVGFHGINGDTSPSFACMVDKANVMPEKVCLPETERNKTTKDCYTLPDMVRFNAPWTHDDTGLFIGLIRPYFHFVSMEYAGPGRMKVPFNETNLEHPFLLPIVITRDPISRLLAGDGVIHKNYPGIESDKQTLNHTRWWDYAVYDGRYNTDNVFLRVINKEPSKQLGKIQNHISEGIPRTTEEIMDLYPTLITEESFDNAKRTLDRFAFVLDVACLDEGLDALGRLLGLDLPAPKNRARKRKALTSRERIGHDDVYEYLLEKNKWDIALYEYSKTISVVRCNATH